MAGLTSLKNRIESVEQLQYIVESMKSLATVQVRVFEKSARGVERYRQTVLRGLQALFESGSVRWRSDETMEEENKMSSSLLISIGSDQGLCGQFNDRLIEKRLHDERFQQKDFSGTSYDIVSGYILQHRFEERDVDICDQIHLPASPEMITQRVEDTITLIRDYREEHEISSTYVMYNFPRETQGYDQRVQKILPIDPQVVEEARASRWSGPSLPSHRMDSQSLLRSLFNQYLFSTVYYAFAKSLAAENRSRLQTMSGASENLDAKHRELRRLYFQERQNRITEELIDITQGFNTVMEEE